VGWHKSAEALLYILLGGLGSLAGPVVGALAFTALGEVAQQFTESKLLVEGLIVLAAVLVLREGLTGLFRRTSRMEDFGEGDDARADETERSNG